MKSYLLLFSIYFMAAQAVEAAVISHDWKTPGDGLLTYDTVNKREWLDLSQTLLSDQFPGTGSSVLEIRESRYQYVVGQTAAGGLFEGFRVARSQQVLGLAQSAGIDTSTLNFSLNSANTLGLQNLLGLTLFIPDINSFSIGLLDELGSLTAPYRLGAIVRVTPIGAGISIGDPARDLQSSNPPPGVMLYRVIPEPSGGLLTCIGIVMTLNCRANRYLSNLSYPRTQICVSIAKSLYSMSIQLVGH
jgi:hypothetical protein